MKVILAPLQSRLERLRNAAETGIDYLQTDVTIEGKLLPVHNAGMKSGQVHFGLFGRDLLTTALMLHDPSMMAQAIRFVCATIGRQRDAITGEEPGRGIHEFATVEMRGKLTRYDATEVSLLLLIVAAAYMRITGDDSLIREERQSLIAASEYLRGHLRDGLFIEDPRYCEAEGYALRATYWKDSTLPGRVDPDFPVIYTLVQAQAIAALRATVSLARPLGISTQGASLLKSADNAVNRLFTALWDSNNGCPLIARDERGEIRGVSSDALHMLAYLRAEDVPPEKLAQIAAQARQLATPYGFRTYAPEQPHYAPYAYHLGGIWPFEQVFIAWGSLVHRLPEVLNVALRTIGALEQLGFVEVYYLEEERELVAGGAQETDGCDTQLWSLATPAALSQLLTNKP